MEQKRRLGWFWNLPIRKKFMLAFVAVILFTTLVAGGASVLIATATVRDKTGEIAQQLAYHAGVNFDYLARDFERQANSIVADSAFQTVARANQEERPQAERVLDASLLGTAVSKVAIENSDMAELAFLPQNGSVYLWQKGYAKITLSHQEDEENAPYLALLEETLPGGAINTWLRAEDGSVWFVKKAIDTTSLAPLGYLLLRVEPSFFMLHIPFDDPLVDTANVAVLDAAGELLVAESDQAESLVALAKQQGLVGRGEMYAFPLQYGGQAYQAVRTAAGSEQWNVICFVSMRQVYRGLGLMVLWIALVCLACIVVAVLLAWRLADNTTQGIRLLRDSMAQVEKGNLAVKLRPAYRDEVGQLAERFSEMAARIQTLMRDVTQEQLKRQAKEYEILQAQVDPHFIYNTLGSIQCMAQINNQPQIERMLESLVEILRMALGNKGANCRLSEELTCVESYLFLQRIRLEDRFSVVYQIDEAAEDLYIVGFILQPLVENALYHGLDLQKGNGELVISARVEGEELVLAVEDNGAGMPPEVVQRLLEGDGGVGKKGFHSIGVRNVTERIQYYFGGGYGLRIHSERGRGTRVEIHLPVVKEAPDANNNDR